jgi:3-hydroxyisobutyrate dehydrogenase-like beta-hydroxyacid dehydrogenase
MADAPVSGGTGGAEAGTLTFMVGGTQQVFDHIRRCSRTWVRTSCTAAPSGTGTGGEDLQQHAARHHMIGVAEAMNLGAALGIDPKVLAGIINTSSGRCWSSDTYNPYPGVMENVPAARGYTGGFGTDLMLKDLGLAADAAKQAKQSVAMGAHGPAAVPTMEFARGSAARFLVHHQHANPLERSDSAMIECTIEGHVALITLNNPSANTFTSEGLMSCDAHR